MAQDDKPGAGPERPLEVLKGRWGPVLREVTEQTTKDKLPLVAAGVAFYALLSLFPALIAAISVFALVVDPQQLEGILAQLSEVLPETARPLVEEQLRRITAAPGTGLGLAISVLVALWTASLGVSNVDKALSVVYGVPARSFVKGRLVALGLTVAGGALFAVLLALIVAVPAVLAVVPLPAGTAVAVQLGRWLVILVAACLALLGLYRVSPPRQRRPGWRWTAPGAVAGTVLWLLASAGFSFYVSNFGSYNETYGALGGVIVLLLWLWITALAMLIGGELNAALEAEGDAFAPRARRRAAPDVPRDARPRPGTQAG